MKTQMKTYSFYRPTVTYDSYGDRIENLVELDPVRVWISDRNISQFNQIDVQGLMWTHTGITKDQRPQKNDIIDGKKIIYVEKVYNLVYLYLKDAEGSDDYE